MKWRRDILQGLITILNGTGYLMLFLEWFLLVGLYLPSFLESGLGRAILPAGGPPPTAVEPARVAAQEPSMLFVVATMAAVVLVLVILLYVLFMKYIPSASKTTERAIEATAERIMPVIAHKPATEIKPAVRRRLTSNIAYWLKMVALVVPVGVVAAARYHDDSVESKLVIFGFGLLATVALACFSSHRLIKSHTKAGL